MTRSRNSPKPGTILVTCRTKGGTSLPAGGSYDRLKMATQFDMPSGALNPRGPRVEVRQVVYVHWPGEPAFILNLGEGGLEIQAMEVLQPGQSFSITFPLPDTDAEVQSHVRIVWADCSGRAGLEFVDVSEYDRLRLKQWMEKQN